MESQDSIFWCFSSLVCIHLVAPATQPAFPTALPSPWHWNPTRPVSTQWEACGDFNQVGKDGWRPLPEKNHTPEAISILNVINVLNHTDLSRKCVPLILGMLLAKHNYKTSAILHKRERIQQTLDFSSSPSPFVCDHFGLFFVRSKPEKPGKWP